MSDLASPSGPPRVFVQCGEFGGYTTSYISDSKYWRVWWLAKDDLHIYATYNCNPDRAGQHDDVVTWILGSLRRAHTP